MRVLLVGGAGYIGFHTAVELLNAGHDVIVEYSEFRDPLIHNRIPSVRS